MYKKSNYLLFEGGGYVYSMFGRNFPVTTFIQRAMFIPDSRVFQGRNYMRKYGIFGTLLVHFPLAKEKSAPVPNEKLGNTLSYNT
jgi:hypothetical protein